MNLTWKQVAYPTAIIGHIYTMLQYAQLLGYEYFSWNGRIYCTEGGMPTGLFNEDVK